MPISQLMNKKEDHYGLNIMGKSTPWQKGVKIHFNEEPFGFRDVKLWIMRDFFWCVRNTLDLLTGKEFSFVLS